MWIAIGITIGLAVLVLGAVGLSLLEDDDDDEEFL